MLVALMLNRPRMPFSREKVKKRPSDILKVTEPGPIIVLRPAVPSSPEAGSENARAVVIGLVAGHLRGQRCAGLQGGHSADLPVTDDPRHGAAAIEETTLLAEGQLVGMIDSQLLAHIEVGKRAFRLEIEAVLRHVASIAPHAGSVINRF